MRYKREYVAYYALALVCLALLVVVRLVCDNVTRGDVVVVSRNMEPAKKIELSGDTVVVEERMLRHERHEKADKPRRSRRVSLFYADLDSLMTLGVGRDVCDSISLYRTLFILKGSVAEDTLKMATAQTIGELLKPHLGNRKAVYAKVVKQPKVAEEKLVGVAAEKRVEVKKAEPVELNKATADELQKVHYVGAKVASAIIEQRESLGGYVDVSQLKDVYYIRKFETYDTIAAQVFVDETAVMRINVNGDDMSAFWRHPYTLPIMKSRLTKMRYNDSDFRVKNIEHFRELFGDLKYNPLLEKYLIFDGEKQ